ncbi:hypothetical protein [Baekduia sp. Peel2402]|uniref:hypothetical protein n=1 Tax=Baekduia sp. Peel2402 TaxID=3458296 RepID=UPI00403E8DEE
MSITTPVLLPVMILDPRERGEREAVIERLHRRARRVDVRLTLDDGTAAEACLDPDEAAWLELRDGDIVPVAPLPVRSPCSAPEPSVVLLREVGHALG